VSYRIFILRSAQQELAKLPINLYEPTKEFIRKRAEDPIPLGCRNLIGGEGSRVRVGDYRVVYEIDYKAKTVTILHIGHRRDIY